MIKTTVFAHNIECSFQINADQEEREELIDYTTIEESLNKGITEVHGIEIICPDSGESIGHMHFKTSNSDLSELEDSEKNVQILGHNIAYRLEAPLTESAEEDIENWVRDGNYQGEVIVEDPENNEFQVRGWWRIR